MSRADEFRQSTEEFWSGMDEKEKWLRPAANQRRRAPAIR